MGKIFIGRKNTYRGNAIVCFLDLLGFSNTIRQKWYDTKNDPLEDLLTLKKAITSEENLTGLILNMKNGSGETESKIYAYNTKFISGSIIITFPINNSLTIADVYFAILGMLNNIAGCWDMCLDNGYTIRGGIDYGDVYWNEEDIIGPAYIDAFVLESDIAKTSRVVCGDKFIKLINDINKKIGFENEAIVHNLIYDVDGLLCVNPNLMYDNEKVQRELSSKVLELMKDQSTYIKYKLLPLHKALINKNLLHVPSNKELKYSAETC